MKQIRSFWSRIEVDLTQSRLRQLYVNFYVNYTSISRQFHVNFFIKMVKKYLRQFHVNFTSIIRQFYVNFASISRQLFYFKLMSKWSQNGVDFDLIKRGKVSQAKTDQLLTLEALKFHMFLMSCHL